MTKKGIPHFIEQWRKKLLLNEWTIFISYPKEDIEENDQGECLADISASPIYLEASIRVYPAWFRKCPTTQRRALIHELCHCITEEALDAMRAQHHGKMISSREASGIIERLTQRLTNIAIREESYV